MIVLSRTIDDYRPTSRMQRTPRFRSGFISGVGMGKIEGFTRIVAREADSRAPCVAPEANRPAG